MAGTGRIKERRRIERITSSPVNVCVHEVGAACPTVVRGQIVDLSDQGLGIVTRDKIRDRTSVTLRVEPWDWSGNGSIRYCAQKGPKFMIGLELAPETRRPAALRTSAS